MSDILLHVHELTKTFTLGRNQLRVLSHLQAQFPVGRICTIQGASGSGKSTLLHLLGGLETPEQGEVRWKQKSIYAWPRTQLADWRNQNVGFIFQAYHLLPELSALENVDLPARIQHRGDPGLAEELLVSVGLKDRLHHRPAELSGGEQQRVALARALRNMPSLVLADEPTGNLDEKTAHEIMELLLALQKAKNMTLIVVTHDSKIAAQGHHRFLLHEGHLDLV